VELHRPDGNAALVLCRVQTILFDELSVEEIAVEHVPDLSGFRDVFERFRHRKKVIRDLALPELRAYAADTEPVTMTWYPPGCKEFPLRLKRQGHRGSGRIHLRERR
jgi:hypothetical protein